MDNTSFAPVCHSHWPPKCVGSRSWRPRARTLVKARRPLGRPSPSREGHDRGERCGRRHPAVARRWPATATSCCSGQASSSRRWATGWRWSPFRGWCTSAPARRSSTGVIFALYTLPYVLFGAVRRRAHRPLQQAHRDGRRRPRAGRAWCSSCPSAATRSLPAVYVLSFLMASAAVFFDPCKLAILPDIVPQRQADARQLAAGHRREPHRDPGLQPGGLHCWPTSPPPPPSASTRVTFLVSAAALVAHALPARRSARRRSAPRARSGASSARAELSRGTTAACSTNTIMVVALRRRPRRELPARPSSSPCACFDARHGGLRRLRGGRRHSATSSGSLALAPWRRACPRDWP